MRAHWSTSCRCIRSNWRCRTRNFSAPGWRPRRRRRSIRRNVPEYAPFLGTPLSVPSNGLVAEEETVVRSSDLNSLGRRSPAQGPVPARVGPAVGPRPLDRLAPATGPARDRCIKGVADLAARRPPSGQEAVGACGPNRSRGGTRIGYGLPGVFTSEARQRTRGMSV